MPLLSMQEAAGELGISRVGVERLIRRGDLPVVRIGRRILIEPETLAAFVRARRHPRPPRATRARGQAAGAQG